MARKKHKNYDEMTVEELRDAAATADISGRSGMNKEELIAALTSTDQDQPLGADQGAPESLPRNHPDYDPRQESLSTNPTRPIPPTPAPEDWPHPLEPSAAELEAVENQGEDAPIHEDKPRQCSISGTGPFVRVGNRIINMAHVLIVNVSSAGDMHHTVTLSMSHGGVCQPQPGRVEQRDADARRMLCRGSWTAPGSSPATVRREEASHARDQEPCGTIRDA